MAATLPPQQLCSGHHSFSSSRRHCRDSTSSDRAWTRDRGMSKSIKALFRSVFLWWKIRVPVAVNLREDRTHAYSELVVLVGAVSETGDLLTDDL